MPSSPIRRRDGSSCTYLDDKHRSRRGGRPHPNLPAARRRCAGGEDSERSPAPAIRPLRTRIRAIGVDQQFIGTVVRRGRSTSSTISTTRWTSGQDGLDRVDRSTRRRVRRRRAVPRPLHDRSLRRACPDSPRRSTHRARAHRPASCRSARCQHLPPYRNMHVRIMLYRQIHCTGFEVQSPTSAARPMRKRMKLAVLETAQFIGRCRRPAAERAVVPKRPMKIAVAPSVSRCALGGRSMAPTARMAPISTSLSHPVRQPITEGSTSAPRPPDRQEFGGQTDRRIRCNAAPGRNQQRDEGEQLAEGGRDTSAATPRERAPINR